MGIGKIKQRRKMETVSASNRIAFLDNIRSLIIIFVLIFHSGASYGGSAGRQAPFS
jgi:peptidoglycan/LPS O-acetylase OafA/YrhL